MVTIAAEGPESFGITLPYADVSRLIDVQRAYQGSRVPEHSVQAYTGPRHTLLTTYASDYLKYEHKLATLHRGLGYSYSADVDFESKTTSPCTCPAHTKDKESGDDPHYKVGSHDTAFDERSTVTVAIKSAVANHQPAAAHVPIRDKEAGKAAINGRIKKVAATANAKVDPDIRSHFQPFCDALFRSLGTIPDPDRDWIDGVKPQYREEMLDASQQPLEASCSQVRKEIASSKTFIKAEAYSEFGKEPRIISPLHPKIQSRMYRFVNSLQGALHHEAWFAFGRKPVEVAQCVQRLSNMAMEQGFSIYETDYSRYDGTVTSTMRELETMIYHRAFPEHILELNEILPLNRDLKINVHGAVAVSGSARASGAPDTCLMNTILNLFAMYMAIGSDVFGQALLGGDDGLIVAPKDRAADIDRAVSRCGFTVKVAEKKYGTPFSFLARIYNWGSLNSIQDPVRLITKAHLVNTPNLTPVQARCRAAQKLDSLLLNDGNTPIISDVLRSMRSDNEKCITKFQAKVVKRARTLAANAVKGDWHETWMRQSTYPNEPEPWMRDYVSKRLEVVGDAQSALAIALKLDPVQA
jgi:hypothetical protein